MQNQGIVPRTFRFNFLVTILALAMAVWPVVSMAAGKPQSTTIYAMGGIPINISAWGMEKTEFTAAISEIETAIARLEGMMSTYQPQSEISRINSGSIDGALPEDLYAVIKASLTISGETGGAFDITVKPLVQLWKQCAKENRLPTADEKRKTLALVGYQSVSLSDSRHIELLKPGIMLDLGGIAKGYFADTAVSILRNHGASRCLTDCGGDITTWQDPLLSTGFRVGVRNPEDKANLLAVITMPSGAIVTSGDYERYYTINGRQYCHIFNPRTGEPIEGVASVTLMAPTGMEADAYATAVFVMGLEDGRRFVESHDGVEAVIITEDDTGGMEIYISPGLVNNIEFN